MMRGGLVLLAWALAMAGPVSAADGAASGAATAKKPAMENRSRSDSIASSPSAGNPTPGNPTAGASTASAATAGNPTAGNPTAGNPTAGNPAPGVPATGLILRGTLGKDSIQMQLRNKPDDEGVEGEYFVFGRGHRILLAGEFEPDSFWMEESANGTDVSGQWEGERRGDVLTGIWRGMDESDQRPFNLKVVKAAAKGKAKR